MMTNPLERALSALADASNAINEADMDGGRFDAADHAIDEAMRLIQKEIDRAERLAADDGA